MVQALLGPPLGQSGSQPSLARVLFAPGRGVFGRGPGSSTNVRTRSGESNADSNTNTTNAAFPVSPKSAPRYATEAKPKSVGAPISTARVSGAQTPSQPGTVPPVTGSGITKGKPKSKPQPKTGATVPPAVATPLTAGRHLWIYIAGGVAIAILGISATILAYQIGKWNNRPSEGQSTNRDNMNNDALGPDDRVPGAGDLIISPAQARDRKGEIQTVEFLVQSWSNGAAFSLNSQPQAGTPDNFSVHIATDYFKSGGDSESVKREFLGKKVRVRGKVLGENELGWYIDVRTPKQIVIVAEK
jgi:hypothetical protein